MAVDPATFKPEGNCRGALHTPVFFASNVSKNGVPYFETTPHGTSSARFAGECQQGLRRWEKMRTSLLHGVPRIVNQRHPQSAIPKLGVSLMSGKVRWPRSAGAALAQPWLCQVKTHPVYHAPGTPRPQQAPKDTDLRVWLERKSEMRSSIWPAWLYSRKTGHVPAARQLRRPPLQI